MSAPSSITVIDAGCGDPLSAIDLEALALRFAGRAEQADRAARIPRDSLADAANLQALTVPRARGGYGAGIAAVSAIARRLGRADPAPTLILVMSWIQHALLGRRDGWPERMQRQLARDALAGRGLINALRVEPALGTPVRGGLPDTIARRAAGGWRLSGRKIYSTGAGALDGMVVFARTDDAAPLVGNFFVPATAAGIRIEETWDALGMRATGSHDVVFEDAPLGPEAAVDVRAPETWAGMPAVHAAWAFLPVAALYLGVAEAARDWLLQHLHARVPSNLGRSLATLERFQLGVGEIEVLLRTSGVLLAAAAEQADADPAALNSIDPGIVKHQVTENAIRVVELAVALVGNAGLSRRNPLERHLRDVLCGRIHTPQSDSVLKSAGLAALAKAGGNGDSP
ncbi:MAG: acyl-CoA/acyl-ACP dehydrogenase [Burkholderiales bacterium]|nr:acyl-CoA/acyl-ACP dehydrogenase [Burkholderiales bacterium]